VSRFLFVAAALVLAWSIATLLDAPGPFRSAPLDSASPGRHYPAAVAGAGLRPVLLVPGWLDSAEDMATLRSRLAAEGWPPSWVRAVTFDDPAGSNKGHARELAAVVDRHLERTGAEALDIVAFSMGGLATRWYLLREGGAGKVRRVAFLASPHRGTLAAHLAWGESREEMLPESAFLDSLNAGRALPPDVEALTIRTPLDTHVLPGESATLPGVPDREVCCPTHSGLLSDPEALRIVVGFLSGTGDAPGAASDPASRGTVEGSPSPPTAGG